MSLKKSFANWIELVKTAAHNHAEKRKMKNNFVILHIMKSDVLFLFMKHIIPIWTKIWVKNGAKLNIVPNIGLAR